MTILDVYNFAVDIYNTVLENYVYFGNLIQSVYNALSDWIRDVWDNTLQKISDAVSDIIDWVLDRVQLAMEWAWERIVDVRELLEHKLSEAIIDVVNFAKHMLDIAIDVATNLYHAAVEYTQDQFSQAQILINNVSQIARWWDYDFGGLGYYLGYLGDKLNFSIIDRLVIFEAGTLDDVIRIVQNPGGFVASWLREFLLDMLSYLLAEALRGPDDDVPNWPFPQF